MSHPPLPPSTPPDRWQPIRGTFPPGDTTPPSHQFAGTSPIASGPSPSGRRAGSRRGRAIALTVIAALAMTAGVLLLIVGQHHMTLPGYASPRQTSPASPGNTPRVVAERFIALETARYNATGDETPPPTRAGYGSVSCAADLAQMPPTGPSQTPELGTPHYTFSAPVITPTGADSFQLLITRTDDVTGDQGVGKFHLQRESGRWVVCGLYSAG